MYYIDLPWYAMLLWVVLALVVILPWIAIPLIAVVAAVQAMVGETSTASKHAKESRVPSAQIGLTMADGGEKLKRRRDRSKKKKS